MSIISIFGIEKELTDNVDFNRIIDAFASLRQRRVPL